MKINLLQKNFPKEWKNSTLESLVDIYNGKTPLRSKDEFWYDGAVSWFTIEDLRRQGREINNTSQKITNEAVKKTGIKILPKNTVLICCTASVGECAFSNIELATNQQFNGLVVKNTEILNEKFLYYLISSLEDHIKSLAGTTTFGFVSVGKLGSVKVLIPTILEQKKIADILSSVDEDIQKVNELILKTEELKKGLLAYLFLTGVGHMKFKNSELGSIPESWNIKEISEFSRLISDKNIEGKLKLVVSVTKYNGIVSSLDYFNKQVYSKNINTYKIIRRNQFAYSTIHLDEGSIGYLNISDEAVLSPMYTVFEIDEKMDVEYIFNLLKSHRLMNQYKQLGKGSVDRRKSISFNSFSSIKLPVPPLEEQKKITNIISSVNEKISKSNELKEKLIQFKKGLMSDLLSGKVRINI